jgi:hypothetical protein
MNEIVIPAFLLDCQDWIVLEPGQAGVTDDLGDAPVLISLSTAMVEDDDLHTASGMITVGLLDGPPLPTRPLGGDCSAAQLLDSEHGNPDVVRYVAPVPGGGAALVAEFTVSVSAPACVFDRIEGLMRSFRWAAA